jgi:hypothetical protein
MMIGPRMVLHREDPGMYFDLWESDIIVLQQFRAALQTVKDGFDRCVTVRAPNALPDTGHGWYRFDRHGEFYDVEIGILSGYGDCLDYLSIALHDVLGVHPTKIERWGEDSKVCISFRFAPPAIQAITKREPRREDRKVLLGGAA